MKRRWKVLIGVAIVLAVLLTLNTIALDNETKGAEVTIDGGEMLELPERRGAGLRGPGRRAGPRPPPIVLVHCYSCSLALVGPDGARCSPTPATG